MDIFSKSKIRARLFSLFFLSKDGEFYLSEIARKIGTSGGTCQRELEKLINLGIVSKYKKYNLVFYKADSSSPCFREMESLFNKSSGLPNVVASALKNIQGIQFSFIFGSYVKKNLNSDSDIDLFIVGTLDEKVLLKNLRETEKLIGREIDYSIYSLAEFKKGVRSNAFIKDTLKNYILILGDKNEFKGILGKIGRGRAAQRAES